MGWDGETVATLRYSLESVAWLYGAATRSETPPMFEHTLRERLLAQETPDGGEKADALTAAERDESEARTVDCRRRTVPGMSS